MSDTDKNSYTCKICERTYPIGTAHICTCAIRFATYQEGYDACKQEYESLMAQRIAKAVKERDKTWTTLFNNAYKRHKEQTARIVAEAVASEREALLAEIDILRIAYNERREQWDNTASVLYHQPIPEFSQFIREKLEDKDVRD